MPCADHHDMTRQQVKDKFPADNPNLRAGQLNIQESKAQSAEIGVHPRSSAADNELESLGRGRHFMRMGR